MTSEQAYYGKGYDKSVSSTHAWRTVKNSAEFVIPVLKPNFKVLDVGSGPGTITFDFAKNYLTEGGKIIGVEPTQELIDEANEYKAKNGSPSNLHFQIGSIYELPFEDDSFDLIYCHQVVIHLQDPILALKELKRVCKPNGYVCVKDADLISSIVYPEKYQPLADFYAIKADASISTDSKAGRKLYERCIEAGYDITKLQYSMSHWLCYEIEYKLKWADATINRIKNSKENPYPNDPLKNQQTKEEAIELWNQWKDDKSSFFNLNHFEIIYKK
ncbi:unnamed protein product [Candida verbasci]|uniref:Methyltransferase domain-containing protein n=1 Tax=Candida verbasci TaxID=1227364 RepID=A0A9W4TS69_9ASCO|nr:unnamed protein product [Candida verbasci]